MKNRLPPCQRRREIGGTGRGSAHTQKKGRRNGSQQAEPCYVLDTFGEEANVL